MGVGAGLSGSVELADAFALEQRIHGIRDPLPGISSFDIVDLHQSVSVASRVLRSAASMLLDEHLGKVQAFLVAECIRSGHFGSPQLSGD
jgi:hypothetical protein